MAMRMRFRMKPPNPAIWAGKPSEREIEIERKLDAIKAKHEGRTADELPEAVLREYGRLSCDLIEESQRRSGITLIKITRNADDSGAIYDLRNLRRIWMAECPRLMRSRTRLRMNVSGSNAKRVQKNIREGSKCEQLKYRKRDFPLNWSLSLLVW